jgi:hypothetical protein
MVLSKRLVRNSVNKGLGGGGPHTKINCKRGPEFKKKQLTNIGIDNRSVLSKIIREVAPKMSHNTAFCHKNGNSSETLHNKF